SDAIQTGSFKIDSHRSARSKRRRRDLSVAKMETAKPIGSPIPVAIYPTLSVFTLAIGLVITAFFFIYEATSSRKNRSLGMELASATVASVFLGFGSLFLLLASGVYV
ncbi:hypothetical protein HID58_057350, partial [Brassica napus]